MSRFIQSLESRTLLSASSTEVATLLADVKQVKATSVTVRADMKLAAAAATADLRHITADLKSSTTSANRAANAGLLKAVKTADASDLAKLKTDQTALLAAGASLSAHSAADAKALLLHPTSTVLQAKVAADVNALSTQPAAKLAIFQADTQSNPIQTPLDNLVSANQSNTALVTDVGDFGGSGTLATAFSNLTTAVADFINTLASLSTDVTAASAGSTLPNMVGTFTGQVSDGSHNQGLASNWTLVITTEGTDGTFSGTLTTTSNGNTQSETANVSGSVAANGSFSLTVSDSSNQQSGGSMTGTISGTTLSGTFSDAAGGGGSFTLTKQ
ncbi:MAG TPA: hypothetical protein VFW23_08055 [Tepidisphaeraceae bacterium]|nr:hypothetical protein [Tepidisphaeraceae bacterium]